MERLARRCVPPRTVFLILTAGYRVAGRAAARAQLPARAVPRQDAAGRRDPRLCARPSAAAPVSDPLTFAALKLPPWTAPTIMHLSVRPTAPAPDDAGAKKPARPSILRRATDGDGDAGGGGGCCCIIC